MSARTSRLLTCGEKCHSALGVRPTITLAMMSILFIIFGTLCARYVDDTGADDVATALYVITTVITTIGYGDITVNSEGTRLGMAFYVLALIVVAAYGVRLITGWVQESFQARLQKRVRERFGKVAAEGTWDFSTLERRAQRRDAAMDVLLSGLAFLACIAFGTLFYEWHEQCVCGYGWEWKDSDVDKEACPEYGQAGLFVHSWQFGKWTFSKAIDYDVCVAAGGWTKTYIDCFYMSVATATTIGFGDFSPRSLTGRMVAVPWMYISVFYAAIFLSNVSLSLFGTEDVKDIHFGIYRDEELNRLLFESIDRHHTNVITKDEFLAFMLVQNSLVSPETLTQIDDIFDGFSTELKQPEKVSWAQFRKALTEPEAHGVRLY